jgi:hypothetical protein
MISIQQNCIHSPSLIQSQLVRWVLPPLINTFSGHLLSDVGLFNDLDPCYDPTIYDLVTLPRSYLGSRFWLPWTHRISCFKHLRFIIQSDREIEGDVNHRIKSRMKMEEVWSVIEKYHSNLRIFLTSASKTYNVVQGQILDNNKQANLVLQRPQC